MYDNRDSVVRAINSPLGFFALSLLTVEIFLAIVLIYSGLEQQSKFWGMMIGAGLFALVVVIVSLLVAFAPKKLTYGEHGHLIDEGKIPYGEKGNIISKSELESEPKN